MMAAEDGKPVGEHGMQDHKSFQSRRCGRGD